MITFLGVNKTLWPIWLDWKQANFKGKPWFGDQPNYGTGMHTWNFLFPETQVFLVSFLDFSQYQDGTRLKTLVLKKGIFFISTWLPCSQKMNRLGFPVVPDKVGPRGPTLQIKSIGKQQPPQLAGIRGVKPSQVLFPCLSQLQLL